MKTKLERPVSPVDLESEDAASFDLKTLGEDLLAETKNLKSGRTAVTLAEHPGVTVVLTAMRAGAELKEHAAKGPVSITGIAGQVEMTVNNRTISLAEGQMLVMAPGQRHSAKASSDCVFQIVLAQETSAP